MQHFQYRPLYKDQRLPGWTFSFYFEGEKYQGIYHPDGNIEWTDRQPGNEYVEPLQKQIHDLMLFHVYDQER